MPSDGTKESEKTIEREDVTEPQPLGGRPAAEEEARQAKERVEQAEQAEHLSEAVFDFGFALFEVAFAIFALLMLVVTVTTAFSLFETAGGLMMLVGIFEVIRQFIKRFDKMMRL